MPAPDTAISGLHLDPQQPLRTGRLFVVSGPSGVGKDALIHQLLQRIAGIARSVSATTRAPRDGEIDGESYHFLTETEFQLRAEGKQLLECAQYGGHWYGTPRRWVEQQLDAGRDVLLKIEVQGALAVRRILPQTVLIFVCPPSLQELERRLTVRDTENSAERALRMRTAFKEMEQMSEYDYAVINDCFETAVESLSAIVIAERHRIRK